MIDRRLSVAPMMDWTDRHCRFLHRLMAPHALLYTEMVTTGALLHGDVERHLRFNVEEHPVALQLGGSDPQALARAAALGAAWGYDEINLNCGCPSDRVQRGRFGACLMREPELVAESVRAMVEAVEVPVTVKCRIGVDDQDDEAFLRRFAEAVVEAGAAALIVHARKAWLKGLSPKQNREIPPLDYARAGLVAGWFPDLPVVLNGGLADGADAVAQLGSFAGIMIGREAYRRPAILAEIEQVLHGTAKPALGDIAVAMDAYAARESALGTPLPAVIRPMLGLLQGCPGARAWRRHLSEAIAEGRNAPDLFARTLEAVTQPRLQAAA